MHHRTVRKPLLALAAALLFLVAGTATAQEIDATQAPNPENAGIQKSLTAQVGAGQGDNLTPGSSVYLIERDPFRSVARGRQLFQRKFTLAQGFGPLPGDGSGNIAADGSIGAGLVDSCAGCHGRPRGSAGFGGNVATRPDSRDAPHLFGLGLQEMLADEITQDLRAIRTNALSSAQLNGQAVTRTLKSKGIRYGKITAHPNGTVDTSRVKGVNPDLRVRPFFAQGETISMREFIVGALNAEMGLETFDPVLAAAVAGGQVITPSGMVLDGSLDAIEAPPVSGPFDDGDNDGVVDEIDPALVDHLEFYLLNYFKPGTYERTSFTANGEYLMGYFGCTTCHVQNLTINTDRRVAEVETVFDPGKRGFNGLYATATPLFVENDDGSGYPTLKSPSAGSFVVRNIFTDFKRHDLGPEFWERNYDGTLQKEFMTEPLWGVGSTAPYGHDGRSINLKEVILRHGGEAKSSRNAFAHAPVYYQRYVLDFLKSLILFGPPDTASNLDEADPNNPDFPQRGHGSIKLSVLFNDPGDPE